MTAADLLDAALDYVRRGWSIIPASGKKPARPWRSCRKKPLDEASIRQHLSKPDVTGLAVITGVPSGGLAARDFDRANSYESWARRNPADAARLPTVRTHRGYHVYGRLTEEVYREFDDGELRADSGHVVIMPPSRHPSGDLYRWINPPPGKRASLPLLPSSLTTGIQSSKETRVIEDSRTQRTPATHATHACVTYEIADAITFSLPTGPGQRNRKLWELARRLKAIPGLEASPDLLKAILEEWHRRALPVIRTKPLSDSWTEFKGIWVRAKAPWGGSIDRLFAAAQAQPEPPIDGDARLGELAALCRELHRAKACAPFFLSARTVARLFGTDRMTAWRWQQELVFWEIVEPVKTGTLKNRQASTWRYRGVSS